MMRIFGKSTIQKVQRTILVRSYSPQAGSPSGSNSSKSAGNVPGLSKNCVDIPNNPVGPKASKSGEYKNPEYFCYNVTSFAEAEVEMAKFRLPAPSNKKKSK
ncbi:uncharacterized protein LOC124411653 [Diprion similis]|uniref:uncharacterized protein LOC124411653 n=1 Tax=Diprion similis TaxID=362088 RepID=UPI001EF9127A|nr:uncharacterized protein LOC124411653 [Diprion similis]